MCVRIVLVAVLVLSSATATDALPINNPFEKFVDDYYYDLFEWDPIQATYAGLHQHDAKLPDLSSINIAKRIKSLKDFQRRNPLQITHEPFDGKSLKFHELFDALTLDHAIRAELLELETVRDWKRNPTLYLGKPAESIDLLMKRSYAEPPVRLRSIIGRLKATPALIAAMKANIENPPREFADLGLIVANGSVSFFKNDLAAWAKSAAKDDADLLREFEAANAPVVAAFEDAAKWIETDLMPRAKGSYALGAKTFLAKLEAEEMVDIPLDRLLAIGEANLKRDREAFIATAKKIDPTKTPLEVFTIVADDHPKPADLVAATRGTIERTRKFLIDKQIVSIPSEVRPTILETPAFMRTGTFASMDTPGAYETMATEAFYYVTPPENDWPPQRKTEHMRGFNLATLDVLSIHEAYPGHYLQFLYAKQFPTKVRKLYTCGSNVEGWAHYTEQMILDEGYGNGDLKLRLAQLSDALLRDCRYVVGIKLHTEGWTVEQGKQFFIEQGFIEPEIAFQEARRGTYNPTYLYYTLGKLQIYKLRDDYKKLKGDKFSLKEFHDEFVKQGGLPIKLIRKIMGVPGESL